MPTTKCQLHTGIRCRDNLNRVRIPDCCGVVCGGLLLYSSKRHNFLIPPCRTTTHTHGHAVIVEHMSQACPAVCTSKQQKGTGHRTLNPKPQDPNPPPSTAVYIQLHDYRSISSSTSRRRERCCPYFVPNFFWVFSYYTIWIIIGVPSG